MQLFRCTVHLNATFMLLFGRDREHTASTTFITMLAGALTQPNPKQTR